MFTEEYVKQSCIAANKTEKAKSAISNIKFLGIENDEVLTKLNAIVDEYDAMNKKGIDYITSFIPKELIEILNPKDFHGCFATAITGTFSLCCEINLFGEFQGERYNKSFKFDVNKKCIYSNNWGSDDSGLNDIIHKYIELNSTFDSWIRFK